MEETISLQEIFEVVKKRLLLITSFTIGAALIAAILSFFILTPIYQSSTQFIVNQSQQDPADPQIDHSTIRTNVELINTYNVIIKSTAILNQVVEELSLPYASEELAEKIDVSSEEDSQVVTVTVKDPNPEQATTIANTTVGVFQEEIPSIMNVDNVSILSEAVTKPDPIPVEPRPTLNIAIATVLGIMIGVGIAFLLEYFDTKVRKPEDITEKLDLPLFGTISTIETEDLRRDPGTLNQSQTMRSEGGFQRVQAQKNNSK